MSTTSLPLGALRGRIVTALLLAALVPLALTASGAWVLSSRIISDASLELQRQVVEAHASAIEQYLGEHLRILELVAATHDLDELRQEENLASILRELEESREGGFVDLGVIDLEGNHLGYAGPYDLSGRNYAGADWFKAVRIERSHVSDVFLGYRGIPHCVIAVLRDDGDERWILRATMDGEKFDALVRTGRLGKTGDAFIVDAAGVYQTPPLQGQVLERSSLVSPVPHQGVRQRELLSGDSRVIQTTTWLKRGAWMLVVQQDTSEIMAPRDRFILWGGLVIALSVILLFVATSVATTHLTRRIARANAETQRLSRDLMRSAKLASLGELSTGLAHEINNPLAIISTEMTNIGDVVSELDPQEPCREEIMESVDRCSRQVDRCSAITSRMLQFGRDSDPQSVPTDLGPQLREVVQLMSNRARLAGVEIVLDVDPDLPPVPLDPTELQQVMVNLISNSLHAIPDGGRIGVRAASSGGEVAIEVSDTGEGIDPAVLDKIFEPFFTTKPVGLGTGLGLSVCYGVVQGWGGTIEAKSTEGIGTTMTIRVPLVRSRLSRKRSPRDGITGQDHPSSGG